MDLVIMAAGLGSRFGGNKQIQPIDDDGNFILDYSVFDAHRAGFDRVILIIREEHQAIFEGSVGKRLRKIMPVKYAYQQMNDVPVGTKIPADRVKPWGTAHAVFSCRDIVSDRFAVINADDFYGFDTFKILAEFLRHSKDDQFVSAGFKVKNTLSENGIVKRGIFEMKGNFATALTESSIKKENGKIFATPLGQDNWRQISPDTMVSMQCFGFSKKLIWAIGAESNTFFAQKPEILEKSEFLLPDVVCNMLKRDTSLQIIPTSAQWYGITFKEDLESLQNAVSTLKSNGEYPQHLYPTEDCCE